MAIQKKIATQVSCWQEIAGDSAFSLGMIAEFDATLEKHGPWFYRRLFWETGSHRPGLVFGGRSRWNSIHRHRLLL